MQVALIVCHRSCCRQLQSTSVHLRELDHRRTDEQCASDTLMSFACMNASVHRLDTHMQKRRESNQLQCSQLLAQNQELRAQCEVLQEQIDNLERNNIRLIQRWTQQVSDAHVRACTIALLRVHAGSSLARRTNPVGVD